MRLIDADRVIKKMRTWHGAVEKAYGCNDGYVQGYGAALDVVENAPTVKKQKVKPCAKNCENCRELCEKIIEKNQWVHLPCKVGDKIFTIIECDESDNFVADGRVNSISWDGANWWIYARYNCGLKYYHKVGDNNYFFTKKEAEKTLKEKENNKQ